MDKPSEVRLTAGEFITWKELVQREFHTDEVEIRRYCGELSIALRDGVGSGHRTNHGELIMPAFVETRIKQVFNGCGAWCKGHVE